MKTIAVILFALFFTGLIQAQDSTAAFTSNATIKQDAKIFEVMEKYKEYNTTKEFTEGYRIQITYTDVRDDIYKSKGTMYVEFPQLVSYVEYEPPYYKLRMGDFKTRLEASYYLQQIIIHHPGAFIVKDKIKLK